MIFLSAERLISMGGRRERNEFLHLRRIIEVVPSFVTIARAVKIIAEIMNCLWGVEAKLLVKEWIVFEERKYQVPVAWRFRIFFLRFLHSFRIIRSLLRLNSKMCFCFFFTTESLALDLTLWKVSNSFLKRRSRYGLICRKKSSLILFSNLTMALRRKGVDALLNDECHILVATDVLARGMDLKDVSHVSSVHSIKLVPAYEALPFTSRPICAIALKLIMEFLRWDGQADDRVYENGKAI